MTGNEERDGNRNLEVNEIRSSKSENVGVRLGMCIKYEQKVIRNFDG